MRILHLLNDIDNIGNGINNVTVDLACAQADAHNDVWVASIGGDWEKLLVEHGVTHVELDQRRSPLNVLRAVRGLRALIRRLQPDVVHAHNVTGIVLTAMARIGTGTALVTTIHREERTALLSHLADRVIVLSESGRDFMSRCWVPDKQLRVLRNGTVGGARTCALPPEPPIELRHPAIVSVSGMNPRKGIRDILHAMVEIRAVCPAHLYLVGDGPSRRDFESLAAELGVADVTVFEGFQPRPDRWTSVADVFVLASTREPGGLVLAEAREQGCAIVSTDVAGNPNMLDDGRAGLMVPPASPHELAVALLRILTDDDERARLRRAARVGIEDLTVERLARDVGVVYRELLVERSALGRSAG